MECHIGVLWFAADSSIQQEPQSPSCNLDSWCVRTYAHTYVRMYIKMAEVG